MNNERTNLFSRIGKPDLICLFAVMHHILNRNIPFELLLNFLNETKRDVLIEYIPYSDPKCQIIFKSRPDEFYYPSQNDFEKIDFKNFEIKHIEELVQTKSALLDQKNNDGILKINLKNYIENPSVVFILFPYFIFLKL